MLLCTVGYLALMTCHGQKSNSFKDERELYAATKQVNQFFRRFNNEETVKGDRLYQGDSLYRDVRTRSKYLNILFDNENRLLTKELRGRFINDVTSKSKPVYLDFHGGGWLAQAYTRFLFHGKEEKLTLFLTLQEEKVGSKWVITHVDFPPFDKLFEKDTTGSKYFLHPLSHELDFLNLHKVFDTYKDHIENYTSAEYVPDHLSLFLNEMKKGTLKFVTVSNVKFHFFQIKNWYFELSEFNRSGYNTGWLISNLTQANEEEKAKLQKFILSRND